MNKVALKKQQQQANKIEQRKFWIPVYNDNIICTGVLSRYSQSKIICFWPVNDLTNIVNFYTDTEKEELHFTKGKSNRSLYNYLRSC